MSTREQLVRRVRELADGSPYVVEDTAEGFDVRVARFQGRGIERGGRAVVAWGQQAGAGEPVDYRFSSTEGRALIRTATRELGFEEHQGTAAGIGLVVGIIGAVGAVLTIVVLLVVWLSGVQFS